MNNVCEYIDEQISEVRESDTLTPSEKDIVIRYLGRVYEWSHNLDHNNRYN